MNLLHTIEEQQLLLSQSQVQTLQQGSDKHKRQERAAKQALSARESSLKRQSVALKYTNDKLQHYVFKEEAKIRRSTMERKDLEDELERTEEEYEAQIAGIIESNLSEFKILTEQYSIQIAALSEEFQIKSSETSERYCQEIVTFSESIASLDVRSRNLLEDNHDLKTRVDEKEMECDRYCQEIMSFSESVEKLETHSRGLLEVQKDLQIRSDKKVAECESQSREISDLIARNENISIQLERGNSNLVFEVNNNLSLQKVIEVISLAKRNAERAEIEKDLRVDEVMRLLDEKNRRLIEENLQKSDQVALTSSEVIRIAGEGVLSSQSITSLRNDRKEVEVSEGNLKIQLRKSSELLSVAHNEININLTALKLSAESNSKLEEDRSLNIITIGELETSLVMAEGKLCAVVSNLKEMTSKREDLLSEISKLEKRHKTSCSDLVLEKERTSSMAGMMKDHCCPHFYDCYTFHYSHCRSYPPLTLFLLLSLSVCRCHTGESDKPSSG